MKGMEGHVAFTGDRQCAQVHRGCEEEKHGNGCDVPFCDGVEAVARLDDVFL